MDTVVPALPAVPACAPERDFLHCLFSASDGEIHLAQRAGVRLSDSRFSEGYGWKDLLDEIQRLASPPMFIVADGLAEQRLWAAVLNPGGYELPSKPSDPKDALRAVSPAGASWKIRRAAVRHQAASQLKNS